MGIFFGVLFWLYCFLASGKIEDEGHEYRPWNPVIGWFDWIHRGSKCNRSWCQDSDTPCNSNDLINRRDLRKSLRESFPSFLELCVNQAWGVLSDYTKNTQILISLDMWGDDVSLDSELYPLTLWYIRGLNMTAHYELFWSTKTSKMT